MSDRDYQLESLRHRMNWISDWQVGLADNEPPAGWKMETLQQEYFDITGYGWDPREAVNIEREKPFLPLELLDQVRETLSEIDMLPEPISSRMQEYKSRLNEELTWLNNEICKLGLCHCGRIQLGPMQQVRIARAMTEYQDEAIVEMIGTIQTFCYNALTVRLTNHMHELMSCSKSAEQIDELFWNIYEVI